MRIIKTTFGNVAVNESGSGDTSIVFVHGNSASKDVFKKQMESDLTKRYHLVSFDLIGHGESVDSSTPEKDYTLKSYAQLLNELIDYLKLTQVIIVGWSLGGHIAIEALSQGMSAKGLVLSGTPPVSKDIEQMGLAFKPNDVMELTGKEIFESHEVEAYSSAIMGGKEFVSKELHQAVARTDGKTRSAMFNDFAQNIANYDQQKFVETWANPIAVLQGEEDAFLQLDFLNNLKWANLWQGKVDYFEDVGHAPFWSDSTKFNQILSDFSEYITTSS